MNRVFASKGAAVVGAAALALALAACSPPNEQPSDVKVDTATEFQAPAAEETAEASSTAVTTTAEVVEEAPVQ